jgi:general stress protein 26
MTTQSDDVKKLAKLIDGIECAMLTTATDDGSLRSRPMATRHAREFDGTLWFFTDADAAKVLEVEHERHVNVSYADPSKNRYVSVSGRASVSRDRAKMRELWDGGVKAWFPNGPDDPKIALLRVDSTGRNTGTPRRTSSSSSRTSSRPSSRVSRRNTRGITPR